MVSGVKWFMCRNDSGADVTESCYPAFNDMMSLGESDTDSDMPHLMDVNKKGDGGQDSGSGLSGDINVGGGLQELVELHAVLVEPYTKLSSPESWKEQIVNQTWERNRRRNGRQKKTIGPCLTDPAPGVGVGGGGGASCRICNRWEKRMRILPVGRWRLKMKLANRVIP